MDSMIPVGEPEEPPTSEHDPKAPPRRRWVVPLLVAITVGVPAVAYRDAILTWWHGEDEEEDLAPIGAGSTSTQHTFSGRGRAAIEEALDAYDVARAALARDSHPSVRAPARQIADALDRASHLESRAPRPTREALDASLRAARELAEAGDLAGARTIFARLSGALIRLIAADARLTEGWRVYACPMVEGDENRWIQHGTDKANPYMGSAMLTCGTEASFDDAHEHPAPAAPRSDASGVAYYTCPMHPSVRASEPGPCPICGMTLTPVTHEALASGEVVVDEGRRQRFGIRTVLVERRALHRTIRAPARVAVDEGALVDVTLRVAGWIRRLRVDREGAHVRRGQPLFTLDSTDLFRAQREHLAAVTATASLGAGGPSLLQASREKLRLLGMTDAQIARLEESRAASNQLVFTSPIAGFVLAKDVVDGAFVEPGARILRIGNLERVWVDARLYEDDLELITVGLAATVLHARGNAAPQTGTVAYVDPWLDPETRTGRARVELSNEGLALRPGAYVDVILEVPLGERLVVPDEAIVYTGPRRLVFVDRGQDRLVPRDVEVGACAEQVCEITSGLTEGERIVRSGNFLVASESRIRSGAHDETAGHGGH